MKLVEESGYKMRETMQFMADLKIVAISGNGMFFGIIFGGVQVRRSMGKKHPNQLAENPRYRNRNCTHTSLVIFNSPGNYSQDESIHITCNILYIHHVNINKNIM